MAWDVPLLPCKARTNSYERCDDVAFGYTPDLHVHPETLPTSIKLRQLNRQLYSRPGNCGSALEKRISESSSFYF